MGGPPAGDQVPGQERGGEQDEAGQQHLVRKGQPGGQRGEQGEDGSRQVAAAGVDGVEGQDREQRGEGEVEAVMVSGMSAPSRAPAVALATQYRCMNSWSQRMRRLGHERARAVLVRA